MPEGTPGTPAVREAWRARAELALLVVVLVVAAALRVAHLEERVGAADAIAPTGDAGFQWYWATQLAGGDPVLPVDAGGREPRLEARAWYRAPGYPLFLAAVQRLGGDAPRDALAVQAVLGVVAAGLAFAAARRTFGRFAGPIAAAMLAAHGALLYLGGRLEPAVLEVTLALVFALATVRLAERPTLARAATVGLALGAYALLRPGAPWLLLPGFAWLAARCARSGEPRRTLALAAAVLAGMAVVVTPVGLRNLRAGGELVPVAADGGVRLLIGNQPGAEGLFATASPELGAFDLSFGYPALVHRLGEELERPDLGSGAASRVLARRALRHAAEEPAATLRRVLRKGALLLGPAAIDQHRSVATDIEASPLLRSLTPPPAALWAAALVGAIGVLVDARARRRVAAGPEDAPVAAALALVGIVIVLTLSKLATFVSTLERASLVPFLAILAAGGLARVLRRIVDRRFGPALAGLAAMVALALLLGRPWASYAPRPERAERERGIAALQAGRPEEAMKAFREAVKLDPEDVVSLNGMGTVYLDQGRPGAALEMFDWALSEDPSWETAHFNRGLALARLGRIERAIDALRAAVEIDSGHLEALTTLGVLLDRQGWSVDAALFYERALAIDPRDFQAANNLAWFLATAPRAELRDGARALDLAERATRLRPDDPGALDTLAAAQAEVGRFDDAVATLDRALAMLPAGSPAVEDFARRRELFRGGQPFRAL